MKINFNDTIEKDGEKWKVWTVWIEGKSKIPRNYERHLSENNFKWYYDGQEVMGTQRINLENRFVKQMENKEKDITFVLIEKIRQIDTNGNEHCDCRMRYRRTEYAKIGGVWRSKRNTSSISHLLDEAFNYADSNNLIGQVIKISDLNKERIVES